MPRTPAEDSDTASGSVLPQFNDELRKPHEDTHYASAVFCYQREMAVKFRSQSIFECLDDEHRIPVGEPGYPVTAVDRGKKVIVAQHQALVVADNEFTQFSLVSSVYIIVDIPKDVVVK